jgi:hypothetical protein
LLTPVEQAEDGFTVHAGVEEHSQILFAQTGLGCCRLPQRRVSYREKL